MSRTFNAEILGNTSVNTHFKLLTLKPLSEIKAAEPGQFFMIQSGISHDPLLKRPFSIYSVRDQYLGFLYRIRGKGTRSLSQFREGDTLQILGPLGNSYPQPSGDFIAVAGGIGIASLLPFMRKYSKRAFLFYGAVSNDELVMLEEVRNLSKELFITTDDGSDGQKGWITEAVKDFLFSSRFTRRALQVYACGPVQMLKALSEVTNLRGLLCHVSMEEHMACGTGACLGCMVKVRNKGKGQRAEGEEGRQNIEDREWVYKRVCKEGPIFNLEDIIW